jgi:hypothetical protein
LIVRADPEQEAGDYEVLEFAKGNHEAAGGGDEIGDLSAVFQSTGGCRLSRRAISGQRRLARRSVDTVKRR